MLLAKSLMSRNLHEIEWFDKAAAALAAYQSERAHICDADSQKAKEPFLNELKEELLALKAAASKGAIKLLEHIYTVHPPKQDHAGVSKKRDSSAIKKKQVLNAIRPQSPSSRARTRAPTLQLPLKCVDHQSVQRAESPGMCVFVVCVCVCVVIVCASLCVCSSRKRVFEVCVDSHCGVVDHHERSQSMPGL
jgi:hypothetical protein